MANEVIRIHDQFYILSTSGRIDDRTRVLKHGDMFAVFDRFGDIERFGSSELGLYYEDTRFLSRLALRLENQRPPLLSSTISEGAGASIPITGRTSATIPSETSSRGYDASTAVVS